MFIKLTKLDNRPVWLNASFIVTVEPRRDGSGSIVVPIGDGLDYDVREAPDVVLRMLEGAPVPTVVPVPVSDCLTKSPADAKSVPPPVANPNGAKPGANAVKPITAKASEAKPADAKPDEGKPAAAPTAEPNAAKPEDPTAKPKRRSVRKAKAGTPKKAKEEAKPDEEKPAASDATPATPAEAAPATDAAPAAAEPAAESAQEHPVLDTMAFPVETKPFVLEMDDDQIARLRKMAPKSISKVKNTLATQFHIADVGATVMALAERGVFTIEGNHIVWPPLAEVADW